MFYDTKIVTSEYEVSTKELRDSVRGDEVTQAAIETYAATKHAPISVVKGMWEDALKYSQWAYQQEYRRSGYSKTTKRRGSHGQRRHALGYIG